MGWFKTKQKTSYVLQLEKDNQRLAQEKEQLQKQIDSLQQEVELLPNKESAHQQKQELVIYENQCLQASIEDIQQNLNNSVLSSKESLDCVSTLTDEFHVMSDNLSTIISNIEQLSNVSEQSGQAVESMSSRAEEINAILSLIRGIAEQTNLLALNAAIEAARAGEAGRGFAVVADEVRGLADKTQTAITEIGEVLNALQANVASVSNISDQLVDNIAEVVHETNSFTDKLNEANEQIDTHFNQVNGLTDTVFMSLAKTDHILWKVNTYASVHEAMHNGSAEEEFDYVDHRHCRLGEWYYQGNGKKYFSTSSYYKELEPVHARVHTASRDVLAMVNGKQYTHAAVFEQLKSMEEASQEVFHLLTDMANERIAKHQQERQGSE